MTTCAAAGAGALPPGVDPARYPFTPRSLDLGDGVTLAYLDEGPGAGTGADADDGAAGATAVVCVHGNPTWSWYWRDVVLALRGRRRVLVPDHVGMGLSGRPPAGTPPHGYPYTLDRRVADLDALLAAALPADAPVAIVAHDWGGMIACAWAVDSPERVRRLVLCNTAAFPLMTGRRLPAALRLARAPLLGTALVRGANAFALGATVVGVRRHRMSAAVRRGYLAPYGTWRDRVAVEAFVRDIPLSPADPSYGVVAATGERLGVLADVPTLLVWGLRDPVFDAGFLAEWRRRLPAAEVLALPDAGHYVVEDAADEVVPAITAFLDRPDDGGRS